ncbi:GAF domain-containing protein [Acetobacter indonesiensis]|uniref:GAF domain-containing protein n=1 Tax=Acetobacter indonesiensis TaxID=104101 RepID=UPI001F1F034F|nr:GAF domain-containing protein [Acetobacter indonesiensis]MCG0995586.1 GAF domain-containing protein [Acetobacter indonesiensis]
MSAPTHRLTPEDLLPAVSGVLEAESDMIANLANVSALVFEALPDLNWAGFYLLKEGELVLGPFQGRVACTRIAVGKGVCGTVAQNQQTLVVPDVHAFPGHIACDAASASEIVLPVIVQNQLIGVLDLDSPRPDRFTAQDQRLLEQVVAVLEKALSSGNAAA